jgi:2,3-dihydroxy-p-cumate/2,3-dihydroxybenzoate 3,4-dioxygenase
MIFEYSVGLDEVADEATHRPRQFGFEPTPAGMPLPNS